MKKIKTIFRRFKTLFGIGWYKLLTQPRKEQIGAFLTELALFFYIILISVGVISCTPQKIIEYVPIENYEKIIKRDSIVRITDTIILEIENQIVNNVTTDTVSEISTDLAFSRAKIEDGKLFHSLQQTGTVDFLIDTFYIDRIEEKIIMKEVPIEKIKEIPIIPKWVTYLVLIDLFFVGFFFLKFYIKSKF